MSDHNNTAFYKAFFQGEKTRINSQLFMNFINNARLQNADNEQTISVMHFDNAVQEKK